jgi:hypothetical protein
VVRTLGTTGAARRVNPGVMSDDEAASPMSGSDDDIEASVAIERDRRGARQCCEKVSCAYVQCSGLTNTGSPAFPGVRSTSRTVCRDVAARRTAILYVDCWYPLH